MKTPLAMAALLLLTGCMSPYAGQYVRTNDGEQPENYCYNTLAEVDCYKARQPLPPNQLVVTPEPAPVILPGSAEPAFFDAPVTATNLAPTVISPTIAPTTPTPLPLPRPNRSR